MTAGVLLAGAAVAAGAVAVRAASARTLESAPPAAELATLPSDDKGAAGAGVMAAPPAPPAVTGAPPPPPSPLEGRITVQPVGGPSAGPRYITDTAPPAQAAGGGGILTDVATSVAERVGVKAIDAALGAGAASTVTLGLAAADLQRNVVTGVAGKGLGDAAAINPAVTGYALTTKAGERVAAAVGLPQGTGRTVASTLALGAVVGPPAAIAKLSGIALVGGVRAVAGDKAARAVKSVGYALDPTRSGSLASKPVAAVAGGVSAAAKGVGKAAGGVVRGIGKGIGKLF